MDLTEWLGTTAWHWQQELLTVYWHRKLLLERWRCEDRGAQRRTEVELSELKTQGMLLQSLLKNEGENAR